MVHFGNESGLTTLRIHLLGAPCVDVAGHGSVRLDRKSSAAIFLAATGVGMARERVAQWLWPDSGDASARANLRVLLHRLRKQLPAPSQILEESGWSLVDGLWVDVASALHAGTAISVPDALALLKKPLLGPYRYDDMERVQLLVRETSERLRGLATTALVQQGELLLSSGASTEQLGQAEAIGEALNQAGRLDDAACRLLMRALLRQGRSARALAVYEEYRTKLADALGASPDRETRMLQLRILRDESTTLLQPAKSAKKAEALLPLIGRRPALRLLSDHIARRRNVWIEGGAGVGKSRLLEELDRFHSMLRVRATVGSERSPYAFLSPFRSGRIAQAPQRTALHGVDAPDAPVSAAPHDAHDVLASVVHTMELMARDGIDGLVLEDVHNADMASVKVLADLIERQEGHLGATGLPSLIIVAREPNGNPASRVLRERVLHSSTFERLSIPPLGESATAQLTRVLALHHGMHWLNREGCAHRLYQRTGGNPYFIIELARAASATAEPDRLDVAVGTVQELLTAQLKLASAEAVDLATLMVVAGSSFDSEMAQLVLQMDREQFDRAWQRLSNVGILRGEGLAHDLAREAVENALPPPRRQQLHRMVAQHLASHDADPEDVARHFIRSDRPQQALPYAVPAARSLTSRGLQPEAVDFIDEVLSRCTDAGSDPAGFELIWQRQAMLLWLPTSDPTRLLEGAQLLERHHKTTVQRLISLTMNLRSDHRPEVREQQLDLIRLEWLERGPWPWWHAAIAAHVRRELYVSGPSPLLREMLAAVVEELSSRDDAIGSMTYETDLYSACCISLFSLESAEKAESLCRRWVREAEVASSIHELQEAYRVLGWITAGAGRLSQAVWPLRRRLALAGRYGQPAMLSQLCAADLVIKLVELGHVAEALGLARDKLQMDAELAPVEHLPSFLPLRLAHALGRATPSSARTPAEPPAAGVAAYGNYRGFLLLSNALADQHDAVPPPDDLEEIVSSLAEDYRAMIRLMYADWLPSANAMELATQVYRRATEMAVSGLAKTALTELAHVHCRMGNHDSARDCIDEILKRYDQYQPVVITGADHAKRLWIAMMLCGHRDAARIQDYWAAWRSVEVAKLPLEYRERFLARHAWVVEHGLSERSAIAGAA